jgi:hypothetical protein
MPDTSPRYEEDGNLYRDWLRGLVHISSRPADEIRAFIDGTRPSIWDGVPGLREWLTRAVNAAEEDEDRTALTEQRKPWGMG